MKLSWCSNGLMLFMRKTFLPATSPSLSYSQYSTILVYHFYRATACNATHGIALAILSVHPSVRHVYCDKTKWWTADTLIPHKTAITLVFWHQHWLVGDAPSLWNVCWKWPIPRVKLIIPCNQYFICIRQMALRSRYSYLTNSCGVFTNYFGQTCLDRTGWMG